MTWEALKKSIHGLINKVNVSNLPMVVQELIQENLIRSRGIFARSILQAQNFSQTFTPVYAAVIAVMNTKVSYQKKKRNMPKMRSANEIASFAQFPQIGELVLKRLIIQFRRAYNRNQKVACLASIKFIAHLVNQQVVCCSNAECLL